jgi:hypothetical protein
MNRDLSVNAVFWVFMAGGLNTAANLLAGRFRNPPRFICWRQASIARCIGLILPFTAAPVHGAEILLNRGFEEGLSGWATTSGTASYTADPVVRHTGLFSARGVDDMPGSLGVLFQDLTGRLIPGEQYTLSGWIKTEGVVGGGGAAFGLTYTDSLGFTPAEGNVMSLGFVTGTQDWTLFTSVPFVLPPMPPNTSSLHFSLDFAAARGTAWFDDLSLTGPASTLFLDVWWANSATGEVYLNGGDQFDAPRPPGWNGFDWNFGDGESLTGYFPQFHVYDDLTATYTASVASQYADLTVDTKSVVVDFPPTPTLSITGVTPDDIALGQGAVEITISGAGFVNGSAAEFRTPDRSGWRPVTNLQFVDSTTLTGSFDASGLATGAWDLIVFNPDLEAASFQTLLIFPGDYNRDGTVDAADYVVWRDSLGQSGTNLAADGDQSGAIDSGDYAVWRAHFGQTVSSTTVAPATVPEPASMLVVVLGLWLATLCRASAARERDG